MADPVLIVTQHYKPEVIGSASYVTDLAEWLGREGRAVTVLTGLAHYPNTAEFRSFNASVPKRETEGNVTVERLRSWHPERRSAMLRIISECLFLLVGMIAVLSGRVSRHTTVVSLSPSIFAVMLGVVATRRGGHHIALVHDIQSGLAQGLNMVRSGAMLRIMRWCERITLNRVDLVLVLTQEMRAQLLGIGVRTPIEILPIWVDTDHIKPQADAQANAPTLLYSGNFGRKQGLRQVLELAEDIAQSRPDVAILLRGDGSEKGAMTDWVAQRELSNIRFESLLPREDLNDGLAHGDIHLVPQNPLAADFAIPSKIYSIMAAGRPFIATAGPGSALWRLSQETGAFVCVPPDNREALCRTALELLEAEEERVEMGRRGRRYIEAEHARDRLLAKFVAMLDRLERQRHRVLILEPDRDGHPREWLEHLMRHIEAEDRIEEMWLVVSGELKAVLEPEISSELRPRIHLIALTRSEWRYCTHSILPVSGFARWWVMRRYLRRTGADAGCFLSLDHLSLPLAFGLGASGRKLSGILFRPSVHYPSLGSYRPTLRERIRDLRKALLYRMMLLNRAVDTVLTLDPFFPDYAAQRYLGGHKVHAVPDPAHPRMAISVKAASIQIPNERITFVMFGVLTARKGVLALLEALRLLPEDIAGRVAVVIAGKVAPDVSRQLAELEAALRKEQKQLWLRIEDRWLSSEEIETLIGRCDVVLAPYQRFVGSSGVLLWAARAGKPLLTQDYGLVGRLVQDYRLGLAADVTQPSLLATALTKLAIEGPDRFFDQKSAAKFVSDRTPEAFAAHVFGSLRTS
ncbi:MAG TPA: glycosyltransferase [Ferrovibrio sp.]|uniref:glycosyltransferase n=1 Tax=Ferrovibrio sp. TaxID=1917215 RepID=UPI002ED37D21